jgi:hypothetical protein
MNTGAGRSCNELCEARLFKRGEAGKTMDRKIGVRKISGRD